PTIGIGAGAGTDGQVLVWHDLLGLGNRTPAKFVRQYVDLNAVISGALGQFVTDVRGGTFPAANEMYPTPATFNEG
ncbi:MAG: 3-methyl-2-oxobutanoate hydroxymethyltransferase, partial [Actinobacteria bacterium]|nr:3-methyl-2-oxobutanoate hydroxymethyltransferase [Actinomycetota bacterium]